MEHVFQNLCIFSLSAFVNEYITDKEPPANSLSEVGLMNTTLSFLIRKSLLQMWDDNRRFRQHFLLLQNLFDISNHYDAAVRERPPGNTEPPYSAFFIQDCFRFLHHRYFRCFI